MSDKKNYMLGITEEEADQIEQFSLKQGLTASDFVVYCVRSVCFGIQYAIDKLAETGHVGPAPWDKKD